MLLYVQYISYKDPLCAELFMIGNEFTVFSFSKFLVYLTQLKLTKRKQKVKLLRFTVEVRF